MLRTMQYPQDSYSLSDAIDHKKRRAINHQLSRVFNTSDTASLGMFREDDIYYVDYSKDDVDSNEGTVVCSNVCLYAIEVGERQVSPFDLHVLLAILL